MKKIIITIILDPKEGHMISLAEKLEDDSIVGEEILKDWFKFKDITLDNIVNVHRQLNNFRGIPFGCKYSNIEELLEYEKIDYKKVISEKIVRFLVSNI